jgi:hypothetical protein
MSVGVDVGAIAGAAVGASAVQAEVDNLFSAFNAFIGVLANWIQVGLFIAQELVQNLPGAGPDPDQVLSNIDANVQQILQSVPALAAETKMLSLGPIIQNADDDLTNLLQPGFPPALIDPPTYFSDGESAAYIFSIELYWIRPLVPAFAFTDLWFPNGGQANIVASVEGGAFVYDPQLSLPAFMTAIRDFAGIATLLNPSLAGVAAMQPYFTDLATFLANNWEIMTDGLVTVPIPSIDDLDATRVYLQTPDSFTPPSLLGFWRGEIGVVDIYSAFGTLGGYPSPILFESYTPTTNAASIIAVYPPQQFEALLGFMQLSLGEIDNAYGWFWIRMRIGNIARFKALYLAKGYDQVWRMIQKLRFMSGGKPGTIGVYDLPPTPPIRATDRKAHWCLSDFDAIIGPTYMYAKFELNVPLSDRITVEDIISRLHAVVHQSDNNPTGDVPIPVPTPHRPLSLRRAIARAAI